MELLAVLLALYGVQCLVHLPRGSVGFVRWGRDFAARPGPGWIATNPVPSSLVWVGERLPWVGVAGSLRARGIAPRFLASGFPAAPVPFDPSGAKAVEREGTLIRVEGRPFARAATEPGAERLCALLKSAQGDGPDAFDARLGRELEDELSLVRLAEARDRFLRATRWHRALVDVYGSTLAVALPAASVWVGVEAALAWSFPVLAALHFACLASFGWSDRQLRPGVGRARLQSWFELAVYPPALLRSVQRLYSQVLERFHPATLAAALLSPGSRRRFLRAELARARHQSQQAGARRLEGLELRALEALIAEAGESPTSLLAPPPRPHPSALAYCPACQVGYRRFEGDCNDCRLPLRRF